MLNSQPQLSLGQIPQGIVAQVGAQVTSNSSTGVPIPQTATTMSATGFDPSQIPYQYAQTNVGLVSFLEPFAIFIFKQVRHICCWLHVAIQHFHVTVIIYIASRRQSSTTWAGSPHHLIYLVLACRKTQINQSVNITSMNVFIFGLFIFTCLNYNWQPKSKSHVCIVYIFADR